MHGSTRGLNLVESLRAEGVEVEARAYDHALADSADVVVEWSLERFGGIDVIISNAAACEPDSFTNQAPLTAESCDYHHAVNVRFPALLLLRFADLCRERNAGGSFIAVSTNAAAGHAGQASYAGSKSSFESYVRTAAWELGPVGIRVNTVSPGPVQTGYIDSEMEAALLPWIPLRRLGRPEDIARAAAFLASDHARWITGQVLRVDGGHTMA